MTARELRLLLESIPDDTPVIVISDTGRSCTVTDVELQAVRGVESLTLTVPESEPDHVHMYPVSRYLQ